MAVDYSIIIPARNEAAGLGKILPILRSVHSTAEIIVVDDGSTDDTVNVCREADVRVVRHQYPKGNGAAIKTGARVATGDSLLFMDADGQHTPEDAKRILEEKRNGYDMVVGARDTKSHASGGRRFANALYNWLASLLVGHRVADLTSGLRCVDAKKFREFLCMLPNGFSYPTTITMAFFRMGYSITYFPIKAQVREGKSHIKIVRDGFRFLLIIFKIGTLYSPLKLFTPLSMSFFSLGLGYYIYTYVTMGRFTNMSALLFITSVLVFLIGLVSEQITTLLYVTNLENQRNS